MGALGACGSTAGILLGSAVGAAFAAVMSTETLDSWGWRIPFLLGIVVGIAGYILRRYVLETEVVEKAHPRSHSRNTSRPLADCCRLRWLIRLQRSRLLHCFCLSRELAPDCRWHSAITRARNQLIQHGDSAAGADRRRMVERSSWAQASYAPCNNRGVTGCLAPILVVEPSLGAARPAWAAWLRLADRYLLWVLTCHSSGSCASERALHCGRAGL